MKTVHRSHRRSSGSSGLRVTPQRQAIFRPAAGRRRAPDGRVALRPGPGRHADDLAEDRVPDRPRPERLGEVARARPRHRHRCGSTRTSRTRTTTWCAPRADGCATCPSSSTACGCRLATGATFTIDDVQVIFRGRCDTARPDRSLDRQPRHHSTSTSPRSPSDAQARRNARRTRTSRKPSRARARPTAATSTSPRRPTSRVTPTSPRCSVRSPKVRPATRSATSTSSPRSATRSPVSPSARRPTT